MWKKVKKPAIWSFQLNLIIACHIIACHAFVLHYCLSYYHLASKGLYKSGRNWNCWAAVKLKQTWRHCTFATSAVLVASLKTFWVLVRPLPGCLWIVVMQTELGLIQNDGAGSDQGNVCSCLLPCPQSASHSLKSMWVFGKCNSGNFNNRHYRVMAARAH